MLKYFFSSYLVTVLGLIGAYLWGEHAHPGTGLTCVFIASVLAILEISLSFDNAVFCLCIYSPGKRVRACDHVGCTVRE